MQTFRIEHGGETYRVEAPDEAAALEAMGLLDEPASENEAAAEVGTLEDVGAQFFENFNKGVYSTLNAPTAMANLALAGADTVAEHFGSSVDYRFQRPLELAAPFVDQMAMETPDAQSKLGEYAGVLGEYAGANALPVAGSVAMAPKLAKATQNASSVAGQVVNNMATAVAKRPGAAATGEALATLGAGTGGAVGRDLGDGDPTAEFIGATIGGVGAPMAAAVAPTSILRKGVQHVRKQASPEAVNKRVRNTFAERIRENLNPETKASLEQTTDIRKDLPEYRPSLAEATESPDLIATQRAFETGMSGDDLNAAAARYRANDAAIEAAGARLRPQSSITPDDAFRREAARLQGTRTRLNDAMSDLDRREYIAAEDLQSGGRRADQGQIIRDELIAARDRTKESMRITAEEMGLNDPRAVLDFASVREALKESVKPRSKLADTSAVPNDIVSDIMRMDDRASIVDMMELRSRISSNLREAQRTPVGEKRVPYLQRLKSTVDDATDMMIGRTEEPELASKLREYRDIYRRDYVEPFETGAAGQALRRDVDGVYRVNDENVAKQFFDGWGQTSARQFQTIFKNSPQAQRALSDVAFDDLYNSATRNGVLEPALVDSWRRRHQGILADFPEIQARLSSAQRIVAEIGKRRRVLKDRQRRVEHSALARDLSRINDPVSNVTGESLIDNAISANPSQMKRIRRQIRTEEGRTALAGRVWDRVLEASNPAEYFAKNRPSINAALGPEKASSAARIVSAIRKSKLIPRPSGQPIDPNPAADLEGLLGTGFNQVGSRIFAVKSGRTSSRYAVMDIVGRAMRSMTGRQAAAALKDAIYDPKAAIDLANTMQYGRLPERTAKRLYTYLLANGILAGTQEDGQSGDN